MGPYGLIRAAEAMAILSPAEVDLCHRARMVRNCGHGLGSGMIGRAEALCVRAAVCALLAKARLLSAVNFLAARPKHSGN
jgi:hypothetical protein